MIGISSKRTSYLANSNLFKNGGKQRISNERAN
nr:MAG TPA: hypothetical protein [Caudoviricetes sp.]